MVGSARALALQGSGLQVLLLDGSPMSVKPFDPQAVFEPRVSALSTASQRILDRLGVWDGIIARRASPYADMHVWDGSGTGQIHRSEEQTSELQSLMRISYAVFCLKKKKSHKQRT